MTVFSRSDGPEISIIIATFNCRELIGPCLDSILAQDFKNFEILVSDGRSSDGTLKVLERYTKKIAWFKSEPDEGIYDAWNKALANAKGEWLCFIGADDRFASPSSVGALVNFARDLSSSQLKFVYAPVQEVDSKGVLYEKLGRPVESVGWQLRHGMPRHMPHTGMLHHRSLFDEFGSFDARFRIAGDYEFILRSVGGKPSAFHYADVDVALFKGVGGVSYAQRLNSIREFYKARKANGLPALTFLWLLIYVRARLREYLVS